MSQAAAPALAPASLTAPWPHFGEEEVAAAAAVLRSGRVNQWTGEECTLFESEYARALGRRHAVAVMNGTVALELCLHALGIGPGDDVIVPSRTFVASASCAVMRGARVICADVDADSGNLSAATVAACWTPRTRAVIAVHLAGWPCDMDPLMALAAERGFFVVEDCAQAHGAIYKGRPVGALGHMAAFSFCQDKIISTGGEGGLVVTDDDTWWERAWSYKDHGKSYEAVFRRAHPPGFRWLHESFGTNWRLTEMQAAMGRVLLRKLPSYVATRRAHAETLASRLRGLAALRVPQPKGGTVHAYYKFYAYLRPERLSAQWSRDRIMAAVNQRGLPCYSGSCSEIYRELAFPAEMRPPEPRPVAAALGANSLMLLVHPTLTTAQVAAGAAIVEEVVTAATAH